MKRTEQQKTALLNILECTVSCIFLVLLLVLALVGGSPTLLISVAVLGIAAVLLMKMAVVKRIDRHVHWYISILDTIPFMMHATDMDMNWIFMNKATADFLKLDRDEMMGQHCSNWNAAICGTDRCSAYCLRQGNPTTYFEQNGIDLRVDTNWLKDKQDERIGYVEVVQDISEMVRIQKQQEALVKEIRLMYDSFVSASSEIANGAQALAQGSMEQASSVEELSGAIGAVKLEIEQNLKQAEAAASLAQSIQEDAEQSSEQMLRMTSAVDAITESSRAISKVIRAIDDIAFQTNILALNAAVEAAHAGQHGKGFAVVADEVRNLATKSAQAAKDTGALIEDSITKAELGAQITGETAASLEKIIQGIQNSNRIAGEIAESSRRQNVAIIQINEGIESVSQVVQQNSSNAEQSAAASQQMNSQTALMQNLLHNGSTYGDGSVSPQETRMSL